MITFQPLWDYLEKNEITKYQLIQSGVITPTESTRLSYNHNFGLSFINRLCRDLNCKVSDIIKYEDDHEY